MGVFEKCCDRNAEIEGVAERVAFEKASASSLPFDDEAVDVVVSNLVFHEVRDVRDKKKLVKEALRVVRMSECRCVSMWRKR